jgi:hypothetical protein
MEVRANLQPKMPDFNRKPAQKSNGEKIGIQAGRRARPVPEID